MTNEGKKYIQDLPSPSFPKSDPAANGCEPRPDLKADLSFAVPKNHYADAGLQSELVLEIDLA